MKMPKMNTSRFMNNTTRNTLIAIVVVIALIFLFQGMRRSGYMTGKDISINAKNTGSIFDSPYDLKCVPGPNKEASPYTKNLTPGGMCGVQEMVAAQANYELVDGIGGSLLA